jgi:hypothetical protein
MSARLSKLRTERELGDFGAFPFEQGVIDA